MLLSQDRECERLRARVAELETAIAAKDAALKPLSNMMLLSDSFPELYANGRTDQFDHRTDDITPCHVKAARAALLLLSKRECVS